MLLLWYLMIIPGFSCLNTLFISTGAAGHVTPMFELAKAMKNHNVTFVTESYAQSYVDFQSHPSYHSFHVIFTNDSKQALIDEIKQEEQLAQIFVNHSLLDSLPYLLPAIIRSAEVLLNKSVQLLLTQKFDVIIAERFVKNIQALCLAVNTPCVIQSAGVDLDIFDLNQVQGNSFLSTQELSKFRYRLYNLLYTLRLTIAIAIRLPALFPKLLSRSPYFSEELIRNSDQRESSSNNVNCLRLISMPQSLFPSSHPDHYNKYLGAFVDDTLGDNTDTNMKKWFEMKPKNSIIYVSFGSHSRVPSHRMKALIIGFAEFLGQYPDAYVLLAFRNFNHDTYQKEFNELQNNEHRRILSDNRRILVGNQFFPQKWILKQKSVDLFVSHCGMGSIVESFYFRKPILCIPLCTDQFVNSIAIDLQGVGLSLFERPSLMQLLVKPDMFHNYTFSANDTLKKLVRIFRNSTYEKAAYRMSMEMAHAGGTKRAVEEIEFFIASSGNLEQYAPFQNKLPFYQRYVLDLIFTCAFLPTALLAFFFLKCCNRIQKVKRE